MQNSAIRKDTPVRETPGDAVAVTLRYFGPLLDTTGTGEETVEISLPDTVQGIEHQIHRRHSGLKGMTYRIAVDETMRERHEQIQNAREIALLPAFSGG